MPQRIGRLETETTTDATCPKRTKRWRRGSWHFPGDRSDGFQMWPACLIRGQSTPLKCSSMLVARTAGTRSVFADGRPPHPHDAASRPITATLPNGVGTAYSYDNANRLTRLSHTTGGVTLGDYQFAVDAVGNRTAITETVASVGQGGDMRPVNGPVQILLPFVGNQAPAAQPTIQSSQNPILLPFVSNGGVSPSPSGPIIFPIRPDWRAPAQAPTAAPRTATPSKTTAPTKTTAPQVATLVPGKPRGELPAARLEPARAGASLLALAGLTETTTINYSYDPLYRVTGASYTGTLTNTFGYSYDAVGNRTVQTQTITSTLVTNYSYDVANRLTSANGVTYSWDDNGNLLNDGLQAYTYDQANRLKQVVGGATTSTFGYNGLGDRLQQTVGITTTRYVLDPAAGLTQVLADGTNTYLYGNARIGQYQTAMQYFGADGLGSVRQIYDATGQVVGSSRYDPYGNVLAQSGATSVFAFTGEQYDAATGLEYLRARYYSSAQGRFTTRDVWRGSPDSPQSLHVYVYTRNNPANLTDPSGHQSPLPSWCQQGLPCFTGLLTPAQAAFMEYATAEQGVAFARGLYAKGGLVARQFSGVGRFDCASQQWTPPQRTLDLLADYICERGPELVRLDGANPITRDLAESQLMDQVRIGFYVSGDVPEDQPKQLQFNILEFLAALSDPRDKGDIPVFHFLGSVDYSVVRNASGRVQYRIDNKTDLSSGTHVPLRFPPAGEENEPLSLETVLLAKPEFRHVSFIEMMVNYRDDRGNPVVSILRPLTRDETGGAGGGTMRQVFTWSEVDLGCRILLPYPYYLPLLDIR